MVPLTGPMSASSAASIISKHHLLKSWLLGATPKFSFFCFCISLLGISTGPPSSQATAFLTDMYQTFSGPPHSLMMSKPLQKMNKEQSLELTIQPQTDELNHPQLIHCCQNAKFKHSSYAITLVTLKTM